MSQTFAEIDEKYPAITNVTDIAAKNNVAAAFINYEGELYFLVCPDVETMNSILDHSPEIGKVIQENRDHGGDMFNCYFGTYHLGDVKRGEVFSIHQDLCDMIQRQSLVKTVFHMHGYHMPKYVNVQSISNYDSFYHKMHDRTLPDRLREIYRDTLKKQVVFDNQYYAQLEDRPIDTKKVPLSFFQKNKQEVDKDYFRKHHITQVNEIVKPEFVAFMKKHLHEHPDFYYYLEKKPFMKLEDISHIAKDDDNYWENDKEEQYFNISFPLSHEDDYYTMVLQYNMQPYHSMVPLKELYSKELLYCPINKNDIWNINSLCGSNGVKFAVDFGEINPVNANSIYQIPVYFRSEDREMVSAILTRLSKEREGYVPMDLHDVDLADKNKPKTYYNPFFTDRQLQNKYDKLGLER